MDLTYTGLAMVLSMFGTQNWIPWFQLDICLLDSFSFYSELIIITLEHFFVIYFLNLLSLL